MKISIKIKNPLKAFFGLQLLFPKNKQKDLICPASQEGDVQ
jgi:hypothetical protein